MDISNLKYAPQMFHHLKGGSFICASATDQEQRNWYEALEAGWENYAQAWAATTGMELARGDGYYFFRKKVTGDRKTFETMATDYKDYLAVMNLLLHLDSSFGVGHVVTRTWLLSRFDLCPPAKEICKNYKPEYPSIKAYFEAINDIILDKDAVKYDENGNATVDFQNI